MTKRQRIDELENQMREANRRIIDLTIKLTQRKPEWNEACANAVKEHWGKDARKGDVADKLRVPEGVVFVADGNKPEDCSMKFKDTLQKLWNDGDEKKPLLTALTDLARDMSDRWPSCSLDEIKLVHEAIDHIKEIEVQNEDWERRYHNDMKEMQAHIITLKDQAK